jgi:hypothetical protein
MLIIYNNMKHEEHRASIHEGRISFILLAVSLQLYKYALCVL